METSKETTHSNHRYINVQELMKYHDIEFINICYYRLLTREPDVPGLLYYSKRIRSGISKSSIIIQIAESNEAKSKNITIVGLKNIKLWNKVIYTPIIGQIALLIHMILNIKRSIRDIRALENHIYRLTKQANSKDNDK